MKWLLLGVIVFSTVLGDFLQSYEMKRAGEQSVSLRGLGRILHTIAHRSFLILAIFFMAVSFFAFMALVQIAPLSFAVPASAATVVFETILARCFLNEDVGWKRAVGAGLVVGGVILISR